ncbi:hypothetical protein AB0G73_15505 [Streptomyces sp. NPDC020719]
MTMEGALGLGWLYPAHRRLNRVRRYLIDGRPVEAADAFVLAYQLPAT